MHALSDRIKQVRGDMSQDGFAAALGVNKATLGGYERGERIPKLDFAAKLSEKFNISIHWLLNGEGPMHRTSGEVTGEAVVSRQQASATSEALQEELREERRQNHELVAEVRQLWRENGDLKVKIGELKVDNVKLNAELDTARKMAKEYYDELKARGAPEPDASEPVRNTG